MSYRSLLFCPDEKTARTVTQVLSELDFIVEPCNEAFAAVKKLTDERYDALVVDCQNEQDATLLFKSARNSEQNHSSLSVAVVEGQTGVAKAFRIGANLVLTKPINIEQSKSTLRVARGLLRKNEAKVPLSRAAQPAPAVSQPAPAVSQPAAISQSAQEISQPASVLAPQISSTPKAPPAPTRPVPAPSLPSIAAQASPGPASTPFPRLEPEAEPTPAPEPADVALLDSLPALSGVPSRPAQPLRSAKPGPIAASPTGLAAAVAPALEKPSMLEPRPATMPQFVTHEPFAKPTFSPEAAPVSTPEFATLKSQAANRGDGATKFLKIAAQVIVVIAAAYIAWEKLQPLQYLHHTATPAEVTNRAAFPAPSFSATEPVQTVQSNPPLETPTPAAPVVENKTKVSPPHEPPAHDSKSDSIAVQELPMSADTKGAAKPAPLMVKPGAAPAAVQNTSSPAPAPPPLEVAAADTSKATLDNLVTSSASVPRMAPRSVLVSQGVSQGLLLKKVPPVYPPLAAQLHLTGVVQLLATINKQGSITNVKVVSGDAVLARAAVDAVRQWKYRPYLLNGQPVDIETQIAVNFQ
jgi:periplasmic protein TonB